MKKISSLTRLSVCLIAAGFTGGAFAACRLRGLSRVFGRECEVAGTGIRSNELSGAAFGSRCIGRPINGSGECFVAH